MTPARVCRFPGCDTKLSRYNPEPYCSPHARNRATPKPTVQEMTRSLSAEHKAAERAMADRKREIERAEKVRAERIEMRREAAQLKIKVGLTPSQKRLLLDLFDGRLGSWASTATEQVLVARDLCRRKASGSGFRLEVTARGAEIAEMILRLRESEATG